MDALKALSIAASVLQVVGAGETLYNLASCLLPEGTQFTAPDLTKFCTLVRRDLPDFVYALKSASGSTDPVDIDQGDAADLIQLAVRAEAVARTWHDSLSSIVTICQNKPRGQPNTPSANYAPYGWFPSHENDRKDEWESALREPTKSDPKAARAQAEYRDRIEQWMLEIRTTFERVWNEECLEVQIEHVSQFRSQLNTTLFAVLNTTNKARVLAGSAKSRHNASSEDFVTVTAINQALEAGLPTAAAILTRRNGQTVLIGAPEAMNGGQGQSIHYNAYGGMALSTPLVSRNRPQRLGSRGENNHLTSPEYSNPMPDGRKPPASLNQSGNEYTGAVEVTDHANLHMGNNTFHGVSIQNLTVVNERQSRSKPLESPQLPAGFGGSIGGSHDLQSTRTIQVRQESAVVRMILQALYFVEEGYRETEVEEAHFKTFRWVLDQTHLKNSSSLREWLLHGSQCFWIQGKAGSGKSTLMKFLYRKKSREIQQCLATWSGSRQLIMVPFYFWHLGTPLQKSYEGMLRSLLHKVLEQRPELVRVVFPRLYVRLFDTFERPGSDATALRSLQQAIDLLVTELPKNLVLFLLIDGVDEYDGDHYNFCQFLVQLTKKSSSVKILVTSRPIPACHQVFSRFPNLRLQDLTIADIRDYIEHKLIHDPLMQDMDQIDAGFANKIMQRLTHKASGVFLWVVLVVRELIICLGRYDTQARIMSRIDELPNELESLYDHMFERLTGPYQREGSKLLQLAYRAFKVESSTIDALQLFFADEYERQYDGPAAEQHTWSIEDEELRIKQCEGRLRSRCCGLLEVHRTQVGSKAPRVGFLHRTVVEYLERDLVWTKLRSLYTVEDGTIDSMLLAASIRALRWAAVSTSSPSDAPSRQTELFQAGLAYHRKLRDLEHRDCDSMIYISDDTLRDPLINWGGMFVMNNIIHDKFEYSTDTNSVLAVHAISPGEWPQGCEECVLIAPALFCMAYGGFHELLEQSLVSISTRFNSLREICTFVLTRLIRALCHSLFRTWDGHLQWAKSIEMLLGHAGPNARDPCSTLFPDSDRFVSQAIQLSAPKRDLTAWHLWLTYLAVGRPRDQGPKFGETQITSAFLKAGADTRASNPNESRLVQSIIDSAHYRSVMSTSDSAAEGYYASLRAATEIRGVREASVARAREGKELNPGLVKSQHQKSKKWSDKGVFKHFNRGSKDK